MNTRTQYDFLQIDGNQNLQLMKVLQNFASPKGVQIYVKQCNVNYDNEIISKKYMNPSASTELEAAKKLFFMEDKNLPYSCNNKKEPNGGISIEYLGYALSISVDGCRKNSQNVFTGILIMSFLTNLTLETTSAILGSKFNLQNYENELSFYKNKVTI